ncbi:MAG: exosortase/archaeosortase family protein [Opitutaceae bacterium]
MRAVEALWALALVLPWLLWGWHMRVRWSAGWESYFGWAVLPFAAYLFQLRWVNRPPAAPGAGKFARSGGMILAITGSAILSLSNIVLAPNPLWTTAAWIACCGCAMATVGLLLERGGLSWVAHFLWIVLFPFLALPWPSSAHQHLVGPFRHGISSLVAELISTIFVPAVASGTVIELPSGSLGVDAACSGIRSMQSALICGFFLGELMRLRLRDRLLLLAGAGGIVVAANFLRVLLLACVAASRGMAALGSWHDSIGNAEMLVVLVLVPCLALILFRRRGLAGVAVDPPASPLSDHPSPMILFATVGVLLAGGLLRFAWHRSASEHSAMHFATWRLQPASVDWKEAPLDEGVRQTLGCRESMLLVAGKGTPHTWIAAFLHWDGDPAYVYAAGEHSSEICLPNTGAVFEALLPPWTVAAQGRSLEFERMRFSARGEPLHVFVLRWNVETARSVSSQDLMDLELDALRRSLVLELRYSPPIEKIIIAVSGYRNDDEARQRVEEVIPRLLRAE